MEVWHDYLQLINSTEKINRKENGEFWKQP